MKTRLALLAAASLLAACAAPLQNGGVEVRPGASERIEAMCRYRSDSASAEVCAAPPEEGE